MLNTGINVKELMNLSRCNLHFVINKFIRVLILENLSRIYLRKSLTSDMNIVSCTGVNYADGYSPELRIIFMKHPVIYMETLTTTRLSKNNKYWTIAFGRDI